MSNTSAKRDTRTISLTRTTRETSIELSLQLQGSGDVEIQTGIGFLDHMIKSLAFHAGWNLRLNAKGDLMVDDHHTAEDCAIILGQGLDQGLADRDNIVRFGWAYIPLDESLSRAVVDLATRPNAEINLGLTRERIGKLACENIDHFFRTFATYGRFTLHLDTLRGHNDHHRAESAFKALALALRQACQRSEHTVVPSTKGVV